MPPPKPKPSFPEHALQKACVSWFRMAHRPLAPLLFAVPNGGRRDPREAARLRAEGVVPGVPTCCCSPPVAGAGHCASS